MGWGLTTIGLSSLINTFKSAQKMAEGPTWIVGTSVEYSAYVEFGTSRMKAQPYLRPATRKVFDRQFEEIASKSESVEDLVKSLALSIEAEAKDKAPVDTGKLMNSIEAERLT